MRTSFTTALACALPLFVSCAATSPSGSPDKVATEIVNALDDGRPDDAASLFEGVSRSEEYRQKIYPLIYEAAQDRYVRGDAAGATALLRFMSEEYPDADAVQRALLYSLFQLRGQQETASPELIDEMEAAIAAVRSQTRPPVWVDLVATQLLIDQGRLSDALDTFERFAGRWDGQPEAIAVYVEDIERYLASH
jgi:outer membrane PBP1 activator LpoA protein